MPHQRVTTVTRNWVVGFMICNWLRSVFRANSVERWQLLEVNQNLEPQRSHFLGFSSFKEQILWRQDDNRRSLLKEHRCLSFSSKREHLLWQGGDRGDRGDNCSSSEGGGDDFPIFFSFFFAINLRHRQRKRSSWDDEGDDRTNNTQRSLWGFFECQHWETQHLQPLQWDQESTTPRSCTLPLCFWKCSLY